MATQGVRMIQDENLNTLCRGTSFGRDNNVSKIKKTAGLRDITNPGKPSPQKLLKNSVAKKSNGFEVQPSALIQHENVNANLEGVSVPRKPNGSNAQKKVGLSGRKALTNITNSKKSSPQPALKKNHPKKLNDIMEEQFLHNHQECINAQTKGMDSQLLFRTFGFDDDLSMKMATPGVLPVSRQVKAAFASPPRHLKYEEIPELPNEDQPLPQRWMLDRIPSPSPLRYRTPHLSLLRSP